MKIHQLHLPKTARHRPKRRGFGIGSGHGKTAGRGTKGQGARTGCHIPAWFEGGQMPLVRRIPKRGFHNRFQIRYQVLNVGDLNKIEASEITPEVLLNEKLIEKKNQPVKILGDGELKKPKRVVAHQFSANAIEKIQKAGGTIEKVEGQRSKVEGNASSV